MGALLAPRHPETKSTPLLDVESRTFQPHAVGWICCDAHTPRPGADFTCENLRRRRKCAAPRPLSSGVPPGSARYDVPALASYARIGAQHLRRLNRFARMWLMPSLILLLGLMAVGAPKPPALLAFAPDENPAVARRAIERPIPKTIKKAALKHNLPVGKPTPPARPDKRPQSPTAPETAPM